MCYQFSNYLVLIVSLHDTPLLHLDVFDHIIMKVFNTQRDTFRSGRSLISVKIQRLLLVVVDLSTLKGLLVIDVNHVVYVNVSYKVTFALDGNYAHR